MPNQLRKYAPPPLWDTNTLYKWSEKFVPKINEDLILFSEDYGKLPTSYFYNRFGFPQGLTYKQNINLAREKMRERLLDDILLVPSCQSFEYAKGRLVKAAGVSNVQNIFIAIGSDKNGPFTHAFHLNITKAYFSMPKKFYKWESCQSYCCSTGNS